MGLPCRGNPRGTRLRVGPDRAKHDDIRRFRAAGQGQALPLPLYSYENRSSKWGEIDTRAGNFKAKGKRADPAMCNPNVPINSNECLAALDVGCGGRI
jgi:hypothetical protein